MKIKGDIVLTRVADEYLAVPVGRNQDRSVFRLNETGYAIWQGVERGLSAQQIAEKLTKDYEIDLSAAIEKVSTFLDRMDKTGILER